MHTDDKEKINIDFNFGNSRKNLKLNILLTSGGCSKYGK
nr:MAG TPA: hypothetical protein [Caudoviricetes sp.]